LSTPQTYILQALSRGKPSAEAQPPNLNSGPQIKKVLPSTEGSSYCTQRNAQLFEGEKVVSPCGPIAAVYQSAQNMNF